MKRCSFICGASNASAGAEDTAAGANAGHGHSDVGPGKRRSNPSLRRAMVGPGRAAHRVHRCGDMFHGRGGIPASQDDSRSGTPAKIDRSGCRRHLPPQPQPDVHGNGDDARRVGAIPAKFRRYYSLANCSIVSSAFPDPAGGACAYGVIRRRVPGISKTRAALAVGTRLAPAGVAAGYAAMAMHRSGPFRFPNSRIESNDRRNCAMTPARIKTEISVADLEKLDIRVGTIVAVDEVAGSRKLMKLSVDLGDHLRSVLAGIRQERADPQALVGQQALFVVNLPARKMAGEVSEGMMFDIGYADGLEPVLAVPEAPIANGARAG